MSDIPVEPIGGDPPSRDLRREYLNCLRRCPSKMRKWLREVYALGGLKWQAGTKLGFNKRTVWRWLRDDRARHVLALQEEMAEIDSDLTRARIEREYERLAFSDLRSLYDERGNLKLPHQWSDEAAAAVQEYSFDAQGRPKVKLHGKPQPLDSVARIRRVLVDRRELSGPDGGPIPVETRNVDELTDEQLEAIARRGRPAPAEPETSED